MTAQFHLGAAMAGGNPAPEREKPDNEFHPTPAEAIDALMVREGGAIRRYWKIWDPCCGDGAAARRLEHHKFTTVGTDLVDRGYGKGSLDFLEWQGAPESECIVTNFPFSLAVPFALQARTLGCTYVASILPATFWHAADRDRLWDVWAPSVVYALTFRLDLRNLGAPVMNCIWCVWDQTRRSETVYRRMGRAPDPRQGNLLGSWQ